MKKAIIFAAVSALSINAFAGAVGGQMSFGSGYQRMTDITLQSTNEAELVKFAPAGGSDRHTQTLSLSAKDGSGELAGVSCTVTNDKGSWTLVTPGTVSIARSKGDLAVACSKDGYRSIAGVLKAGTTEIAASTFTDAADHATVRVPFYAPSLEFSMDAAPVTQASNQ